ncbi:MAG: hypothetical protein A3A51_03985 [Candidatus Levybacteria bacterium RIFCSPLOWO2_01_FULL_39_10]|nr:MAG: hypothetical protein A3A51_03985 [Candidatus Levybacteria bacterium RIFCSPLOWO2_01_FULL_39_10]
MNAKGIILKYIDFFERRGHKLIPNSPLVPENDPTTLFTSAGMQPLIPYLLGEPHPQGRRLVNVQNCFRSQDIDEVGDNRHTTFFRMLGNWSLGDPARNASQCEAGGYFKREEIGWLWEFLTRELRLPKDKLYITVFAGDGNVPYDKESEEIWKEVLSKDPSINSGQAEKRIFAGDVTKNWWSRSGIPDNMPKGEVGGPDTEVYFKFDDIDHSDKCDGDDPTKCECGKFLEIANSVFIEYQKTDDGFSQLPQKNVDFGGGLERLLAAVEGKSDIFESSIFSPIISVIEQSIGIKYSEFEKDFRIIADHMRAGVMLANSGVTPSNKEQGYILRRLLRRSLDSWNALGGKDLTLVIETIASECSKTDPEISGNFERIKNTILEEEGNYKKAVEGGKKLIEKELEREGKKTGGEIRGKVEISADLAFKSLASFGLGPTQLRSLGYEFNEQELAEKIKQHQEVSKKGADKKFAGGLADQSEQTIKGHTATHLLHKAIRDMLGSQVHQKGSNITAERVRFDFNWDDKLTDGQIKQLEEVVNKKIDENLPVFYKFMSTPDAKKIGAIGLFDEKYEGEVKIYMIGSEDPDKAYSIEFCGGPHVAWTREVKSFKIIKQENLGRGLRRLYAVVG